MAWISPVPSSRTLFSLIMGVCFKFVAEQRGLIVETVYLIGWGCWGVAILIREPKSTSISTGGTRASHGIRTVKIVMYGSFCRFLSSGKFPDEVEVLILNSCYLILVFWWVNYFGLEFLEPFWNEVVYIKKYGWMKKGPDMNLQIDITGRRDSWRDPSLNTIQGRALESVSLFILKSFRNGQWSVSGRVRDLTEK